VPWARQRCRISPSRLLAECRKRRLNQASFVLRCVIFFVMFSFCIVCFLTCLLSCIFDRDPTWLALYRPNYCANVPLRIYSLIHAEHGKGLKRGCPLPRDGGPGITPRENFEIWDAFFDAIWDAKVHLAWNWRFSSFPHTIAKVLDCGIDIVA